MKTITLLLAAAAIAATPALANEEDRKSVV